MSSAEAVAVILNGIVPLLVALASLLWWAYRRGELSGAEKARREAVERSQAEDKAKIEAHERLLAEMRAELAEARAELASRQPKRKKGPCARRDDQPGRTHGDAAGTQPGS